MTPKNRPKSRRTASYVPIDPCQGVIAVPRIAMDERITREFIDLETADLKATAPRFPILMP